ncbi:hypothetical protein ACCO45_010713 [Purpureocillium lilacinum]|uniref:Uncharacterized protein n=1 Tax=Purpureocillium lilacinum TaxID=33203 RepID=A0ACC4DFP6_PURLI
MVEHCGQDNRFMKLQSYHTGELGTTGVSVAECTRGRKQMLSLSLQEICRRKVARQSYRASSGKSSGFERLQSCFLREFPPSRRPSADSEVLGIRYPLIASSSAAMPHCLRGLPAGGLGGLWRRRLGSLVIVRLEFDLRVSFFDVPTESEVEGAAEHSRACHGGSCQSMSRKHADAIPISQKTRCLGDE